MGLTREQIQTLIFGTERLRRFTQDSPVLPDVWLAYINQATVPVDLLLTPYKDVRPSTLYQRLREQLEADPIARRRASTWELTYNEAYVVARLTLRELVRGALPLTHWWARYVWPEPRRASSDREPGKVKQPAEMATPVTAVSPKEALRQRIAMLQDGDRAELLATKLAKKKAVPIARGVGPAFTGESFDASADLLWMIDVVGAIAARAGSDRDDLPDAVETVRAFQTLIADLPTEPTPSEPMLWSINVNRSARLSVWKSTLAVKADAARRVFDLSCRGLRWGVMDTGIDATHPAFRRRDSITGTPLPLEFGPGERNSTRIVATYDFTRLRDILRPDPPRPAVDPELDHAHHEDTASGPVVIFHREDRIRSKEAAGHRSEVRRGAMLDWGRLKELLRVPMDDSYAERGVPRHPHGTHVGAVIGGDWRKKDGLPDDHDMIGMCPDIELIDIRVLGPDGTADEFSVLAALQFVRYLNSYGNKPFVHGINLSMSLRHDVMNYACGRTPVCEECTRLVDTGTVVVSAAGNEGHSSFLTTTGERENFRSISITDPGNAEAVITVGATHRNRPHSYGVSYFSSRGPTGDGRVKPDLVAPGEKITAAVPGDDLDTFDGTSMAAPHVSGAAALLMARHDELIGDPDRIKQVLCDTATDLGREPFFQGHGMLDTLRALESI